MVGGLINIVSYGFNDLYLTGSPQITFFKIVYRRHTNFSKESIVVPVGQMNFGNEISVNLPKVGDLFTNTFIQLQIPEVSLLKTDTASDLTTEEISILTAPLEIDMTADEIEIVNDYQIIINFMAVNIAGYRIAIDNQSIKNNSIHTFVDSINSVLNYSGGLDSDYRGALSRAATFENTLSNSFNDGYILDYRLSDIKHILATNFPDINAYNNYTIPDVVKWVTSAVEVCIKVKGYYFKKVQKKYSLDKDANSLYAKFAWVEKLGFAMIDRVDINIGGERIDRHYGDWLNIWYELTSSVEQDNLYNKLLGNVKELTTFDRNSKPSYVMTIPLNFWFCRKMGLAFPLISLQYNPVSITIKLKDIDECAYLEELPQVDSDNNPLNINALSLADIEDNQGWVINVDLLVEYIYLDSIERKRFAQSAHEYLIETVEKIEISSIFDSDNTIELDFTGPSKEIIWHVKKAAYNSRETTFKKYPFVYSLDVQNQDNSLVFSKRKKDNPVNSAQLLLNGKERFIFAKKEYFNLIEPLEHHTRVPSEGINVYSFGLYPEEHQPSSTCNFSVISNPSMLMTVNDNMFSYLKSDVHPNINLGGDGDEVLDTDVIISIYSVRYQVIRFIGGFGAFAYSYSVAK